MMLCVVLPVSVYAAPEQPSTAHPLIGIWSWITSAQGCTEMYNFKANGNVSYASGEEVGDGSYQVDAAPNPEGLYQFVSVVAHDNGKKDCRGVVSKAGDHMALYVRFAPDHKSMKMCTSVEPSSCFGPLTKE